MTDAARDIPGLTLVLGGARSGKSAFAERELLGCSGARTPVYLATAQAWDDEMRTRIAAHRDQREGAGWKTIEEPIELSEILAGLDPAEPVLVDCLTLWVSNLLLAERDTDAAAAVLLDTLARRRAPCVLVANEVGLGIVPDNALARQFRDAAGILNQRIAARAERVVLVAAGLPVELKSGR